MEPTNSQILEALIDFRNGVAEKFDGIDKHFARVDENFTRVDENFARTYLKLEEHDRRFDGIEYELQSVGRHVGRLETRIEDIERRLPA